MKIIFCSAFFNKFKVWAFKKYFRDSLMNPMTLKPWAEIRFMGVLISKIRGGSFNSPQIEIIAIDEVPD